MGLNSIVGAGFFVFFTIALISILLDSDLNIVPFLLIFYLVFSAGFLAFTIGSYICARSMLKGIRDIRIMNIALILSLIGIVGMGGMFITGIIAFGFYRSFLYNTGVKQFPPGISEKNQVRLWLYSTQLDNTKSRTYLLIGMFFLIIIANWVRGFYVMYGVISAEGPGMCMMTGAPFLLLVAGIPILLCYFIAIIIEEKGLNSYINENKLHWKPYKVNFRIINLIIQTFFFAILVLEFFLVFEKDISKVLHLLRMFLIFVPMLYLAISIMIEHRYLYEKIKRIEEKGLNSQGYLGYKNL